MAIEVKVPDIGDFKDVPVIEIHVKVGDTIKADDPLVSLESDKATMDVPAPQDGTVEAILVKVGDKVAEGTPVLTLQAAAGDAPVTPPPSVIAQQEPAPAPKPTSAPPAQPARAAAEAAGTGLGACEPERAPAGARARGRSRQAQGHRREGPDHQGRRQGVPARPRGRTGGWCARLPAGGMGIPEIPAQDFAKFGPIETRPMARIKRISGPFLHRAWLNIPHVTHGDEADVTELDAYRKQLDDAAKADKKSPYRVSLLAVPDEGQRLGPARLPRVQQLAQPGEGQPDLQEVLQCRDRGRHAGRSGRAGGQGCRPQGHRRAEP